MPAPYGVSAIITGITVDWNSHRELAPGSDNWPVTWAADGHRECKTAGHEQLPSP